MAWRPWARWKIGSTPSRPRSGRPHRNPSQAGASAGSRPSTPTIISSGPRTHRGYSGYAISSHENELGILAELGLIGLTLWICVLALIAYRLWDAYRTLPDDDLCGKPLAVTAIMAVAIFVCCGTASDLRFFDFPTATIFLLAGVAIGWSDRHKLAQAAAGDVATRPLSHQHG